jgi:hypothetical protein
MLDSHSSTPGVHLIFRYVWDERFWATIELGFVFTFLFLVVFFLVTFPASSLFFLSFVIFLEHNMEAMGFVFSEFKVRGQFVISCLRSLRNGVWQTRLSLFLLILGLAQEIVRGTLVW